jgi:hypothetical protein
MRRILFFLGLISVGIACSSTTVTPNGGSSSSSGDGGPKGCTAGGNDCTVNGEACSVGKLDCNRDAADGCEADSANDPSNCGGCGKQCAKGSFCSDGACVDRCPASKVACGQSCVDTKSDTTHCGACGNVCKAGEGCVDGACGGACAESPCKLLLPQCGCTTGQGCYVDDQQKRTCLAAGKIALGEPCPPNNDTQCVPGTMCREHKVAGESSFFCTKMCASDADCGVGAVCLDTIVKGVRTCTASCDPVAQTGCNAQTKCVIIQLNPPNGDLYTECSPKGTATGQQGATCTFGQNSCAPGHQCFGDQVGGVTRFFCGKYCTGTECAPGTTCDQKTKLKTGPTYGACFPN